VERPEAAPRVVEHAVEDDPHPAGVGLVEQHAQRQVPAEQGVDRQVVVRVVPVVRRRGEDGCQVQRRDPEVDQVRQPLGDPQQVAALEPVLCRGVVPGLERTRRGDPAGAREAVREDLVEDGVANPVGR
jgi:hypothetical protein